MTSSLRSVFASVLSVCFLMMAATTTGVAQTADEGSQFGIKRVGLVDLSYVLRNANATNIVRELLASKKEEFSEEFQIRESELLQMERALNVRRSELSGEDFNKEVQKFQEEVAKVQREIQFKRNSLDQAFQQAQDNLRALSLEIVTFIAQREQLDMVLTRETAVIFRPELNITQEVLSLLNERTKNARIEVGELPF